MLLTGDLSLESGVRDVECDSGHGKPGQGKVWSLESRREPYDCWGASRD